MTLITDRDPEFLATITTMYSEELGRAPDPSGLAAWLDQCRQGMTGEQLRTALHDSPEGVAYRARPPAPTVPPLLVRGPDFVDPTGARLSLSGCDGFLDYRLWLDGGPDALDPFMRESREIGFVVRRVFLQGAKSQNQVMDLWPSREPQWASQLRPFVAYENAHGIIPLLTLCVDNQVVGSNLQALWRLLHEQLVGLSYLASWGNELNKNGANPDECPTPPPGVIWSRGSRTQDEFYAPNGATATEFHPVRGIERTQMDAVASVFYMRAHDCGMLWMDEGYPFDAHDDPAFAWALGRDYGTRWALAVFHNRQGQRGHLLLPGTRACAEAWVRGMQR